VKWSISCSRWRSRTASEHLYTRSDCVDSNRFIQKVLLLRIRSVSMIDKLAAACRALLVCLA
jgi:hypothetical protein